MSLQSKPILSKQHQNWFKIKVSTHLLLSDVKKIAVFQNNVVFLFDDLKTFKY